jgi:hypothetical protein
LLQQNLPRAAASKRADGIAIKGKTKGTMMAGGGMAKMMAGGGKAKMMASGGMPMVDERRARKFLLSLPMVKARWLLVVALK